MSYSPPTDQELQQVEQLKTNIQDITTYTFSDIELLRFLRGRKWIMEDAEKSLRRHCQWRIDLNVANITEDMVSHEISQRKAVIHGFTRDSKPIIYVFARRHRLVILLFLKYIIIKV
jgi:hypothetical protein